MKVCPKCNAQVDDAAAFCTSCGAPFAEAQGTAQDTAQGTTQGTPPFTAPVPPVYAPPYFDPYDHTAEFDPKDISDNKVICMLVYLMGVVGVIVALLVGNSSPYTAFHVRQALKFTVVEILTAILSALLCWTIIVPVAAAVMMIVLFVIKIICFFQICSGKAVEPAVIRGFTFLK